MAVLSDIIEAVRSMAEDAAGGAIQIGSLLPGESIALILRGGNPEATFLSKGSVNELRLMLDGKSADQKALIDTLDSIHRALTQRTSYPETETYQITNIITVNHPFPDGYDESRQLWEISSDLAVSFYYKKKG